MRKLKTTEVASTRAALLEQQGGKCALCGLTCTDSEAVLDHDHATGLIRAVLHRGCNAMLGKVENNHKRYGIKHLGAFLNGANRYMQFHAFDRTGLLHPTHKTPEEKRLARNAKARKTRATKKAQA